MGFIYEGRKLCCDSCGKAGARKVNCPFGYCPRVAQCPDCFKANAIKRGKAYHRSMGCEDKSIAYKAKEAETARRLANGDWLRCSAMNRGERVLVLFRNATGATIGFYMMPATYSAISFGVDATPDDYRKHGELTEGPANFYS